MSNIISKIRQRIALKENNKFNLSCDHITTTDFFKIQPVYFKELVPNEKININVQTFTRLSPLVNPMYGRCRITNRAFFVPFRTIMKGWNEFITDTPYEGKYLQVPLIDPADLSAIFTTAWATVVTTADSDFKVVGTNATVSYKFTAEGRRVWSILCSLGYRYPIGYYANHSAGSDAEKFSALPLLAYAKIFKDWYKNQAYFTTAFDGLFDISYTASGTPQLSQTQLTAILTKVNVALYDKDYFTSAWDRPTTPNNNLHTGNEITDITQKYSQRTIVKNESTATGSTPMTVGDNAGSASNSPLRMTQYAVDALKALTDYMKRHQLAGGLAMDRMLSRFGLKPSDAALDRSVYIGKDEVDVQIADVMATGNGTVGSGANTKTSVVGDYAGKGVGFSRDGHFKYETGADYGILMIISVLQPKIGYVQGCNRFNLHRNRLDFFTPEFDSLGVQAIARKELMYDFNNSEGKLLPGSTFGNDPIGQLEGVFGYTSRYAEYKCAKDNLTGDFITPSLSSGLNAWHLNRMFDPAAITSSSISHNEGFCVGEKSQYDRIFSLTSSEYDHFINIYHFEVVDYAPMAKLFDDYEFDGGNKQVSIEVDGTQLN